MTQKDKDELLKMVTTKDCVSDDDILDFCDERGLNAREAFRLVSEHFAPECCRGCNNIELYPSMSPCIICSRGKKDYYETVE